MSPPFISPTTKPGTFERWAFGAHGPATVGEAIGDYLTLPVKRVVWWARARHRQEGSGDDGE